VTTSTEKILSSFRDYVAVIKGKGLLGGPDLLARGEAWPRGKDLRRWGKSLLKDKRDRVAGWGGGAVGAGSEGEALSNEGKTDLCLSTGSGQGFPAMRECLRNTRGLQR